MLKTAPIKNNTLSSLLISGASSKRGLKITMARKERKESTVDGVSLLLSNIEERVEIMLNLLTKFTDFLSSEENLGSISSIMLAKK